MFLLLLCNHLVFMCQVEWCFEYFLSYYFFSRFGVESFVKFRKGLKQSPLTKKKSYKSMVKEVRDEDRMMNEVNQSKIWLTESAETRKPHKMCVCVFVYLTREFFAFLFSNFSTFSVSRFASKIGKYEKLSNNRSGKRLWMAVNYNWCDLEGEILCARQMEVNVKKHSHFSFLHFIFLKCKLKWRQREKKERKKTRGIKNGHIRTWDSYF